MTTTRQPLGVESKQYVGIDEQGALRIVGTRVLLDCIVDAFREGHSPETIQQMFASLTLEQVYGGCAFYLANKAAVDAYLEQGERDWAALKAKMDREPNPVLERIRKFRSASGAA